MSILTTRIQQEVELPAQVDVVFINETTDYQRGIQSARRVSSPSQQHISVQLPIVLTDLEAKAVADRLLYNAWIERHTYIFQTSRKYAYLEPTDVLNVRDLSTGKRYSMRITSESVSRNGMIEFNAVADEASIYAQKSTTGNAWQSPQTVYQFTDTRTVLLDIPMLRDEDTAMGVYMAMNGLDASWPGAVLMKSTDGGTTYAATFVNSRPSITGACTTALGDFYGGNVFDELNSVNIQLDPGVGGTLSSVTMDDVLNGFNVAAIRTYDSGGWEIIQYRDAVLQPDGSYTLTGLLRGRKGSEWAMPLHDVGDQFVALSSSATVRVILPEAEVGALRHWKGVTFQQRTEDADMFAFTNGGECWECYSPVAIGGGRNTSGDVTINWIRRTRVGGHWGNFTDVPLGEASESYEVEIWDSTYATLKRTITGLSSPTTIYTAAQQTTDFGVTQATVYVKVFQISATNGRGHEGKGAI